jgi:diguanylate cyclase (GGDEF)-like protein
MSTPSSELLRIDPLTGCRNFLGFLETYLNISLSDSTNELPSEELLEASGMDHSQYSAILFVDLNNFDLLNKSKGREYGDSVLHWMGLLLAEESNSPAYRLDRDEFAVILNMETREEHAQFMDRMFVRMNREAKLLGFPESPARLALILYDQSPANLVVMFMQLREAMVRVKGMEEIDQMIFHVSDFEVSRRWNSAVDLEVSSTASWLSYKSICQVLEMGRALDQFQQQAYTDMISGLPNMKAALLNMEETLQTARSTGKPFSLLFIDGDNIRLYNSINYAAGDKMIRDMSAVFKNNLRPNDFVARWRTGDEFMVILPETPAEGAEIIGERFRVAIQEASKGWLFPTTISIGVASYPSHGENINSLIDKAESANKRAKDQGKDQVVLAN